MDIILVQTHSYSPLQVVPRGWTCSAKQDITYCWNHSVPSCWWKSIPSIDAVLRPRFSPLTEVINRSPLLAKALSWEPSVVSSGQKNPHLTGSFWSDNRPSGLKFSANGLLGGCVAVRSISLSCVSSMAIRQPRPQPLPEERAAAAYSSVKPESGKYTFPAVQESLRWAWECPHEDTDDCQKKPGH